MRFFALVGLLAASTSWAQQPAPNSQQSPSQVQTQGAPGDASKPSIVVPAGTRIPAKLASPVTTKSGRPGDTVRAVTTFPVTVDTQLVIPVGSYIQGVIDKVNRRGPSGPVLLMHFTRILYGNGYGVPVDATNTQAKVVRPSESSPNPSATTPAAAVAGLANSGLVLNQFPAQPTIPPLAAPPSHIGAVIGVAVGGAAAAVVAIVLAAKHGGVSNSVLFDTGWQFEMVLQSPLSVDAASVTAAVDASNAQ